jgi:putative ABC transport system permease protein
MITTLLKLSFAGFRSRILVNALTAVLCMASAATIVLTLNVRETVAAPWEKTFEAAHGAHVLVTTDSEANARKVATVPDIAEVDEPAPYLNASMTYEGRHVIATLIGLTEWPTINIPLLTEGERLGGDGIVLERSFARTLGAQIGSIVEFKAGDGLLRLPVTGIAISPSQSRYPRQNPGLGWVTETSLSQITPDPSYWRGQLPRWQTAIRLADPALTSAFANHARQTLASTLLEYYTWQEFRFDALMDTITTSIILSTYTVLLLIVLYLVTAILVSERAIQQYREIGLLKAVGLTPNQIGAIFLLESASLGIVAVLMGCLLGTILAPVLAAPSAETLIDSPAMTPDIRLFLITAVVILPVLLISAVLSTLRSTRFSVLQTLRAGASLPVSPSRLVHTIARSPLPLPITLGVKELLARRKRAFGLMSTIAVTGAVMVVTLTLQANINARPFGSDIPKEFPLLFYTLDIVLMLVMISMLIAVAFLSVRERTRDFGILKTIGLTPGQIAFSIVSTQVVLAIIASALSIPLGIALFYALYALATGTTDDPAQLAPWWWLVLIPAGGVLLATLATILPARIATKSTSAAALRYE